MSWKKFELVALVAVALAGTTRLEAALVLEHDFQVYVNVPVIGGDGATASFVVPGASPYIGPRNGAVVNTGTALGTGYAPNVANGYVTLQPNGSLYADPDDAGMVSENTTAIDHLWPAYMGDNRFNQGSVAVVIKPSFSGEEANRHTFFWTGNNNQAGNLMWLMNDDDQKGPALRTGSGILVSLDNYVWDSGTWYLLAASWRDNAEAGGPTNTLYIRPLSPTGVATSATTTAGGFDSDANVDQYLSLGRRADSLEESASSDMALFQLYNNYMSVNDFDAHHASLSLAVAGDFDGDSDVDGADFVVWQTNFPKPSGATLAEGDADGDGDVDGADFVVWQTNFPTTSGPGVSPVPEPASLSLIVIGCTVACLWRRRVR